MVLAAAACIAASAGADPITGRVVDEHDQPVAGVQVSAMWQWADGRPVSADAATTAADGSFTWETPYNVPDVPMIAYSDDATRAGLTITGGDSLTIVLKPSVRVTATLTSTDLGGDTGAISVYWQHGNAWPINTTVVDGRLDMRLPAAAFNAFLFSQNVKGPANAPAIDGTESTVDLGTIDLKGTFIALNVGLPAPEWKVSESRHMDVAAAQIKDLKGRWVLVEFWGFW